MAFNSLEYLLFLPIALAMYHCLPPKIRWLSLLVVSYAFYLAYLAPQLLVALWAVTLASYGCGRWLQHEARGPARTWIFWLGAATILGILILVKFIPPLIPALAGNPGLAFLLNAVGISYIAFQAISYLADIYLEILEPERQIGHLALSLAYFPKLSQGPIERSGTLLPQLHDPKPITYNDLRSGLLLICIGLAKKVIIADRMALYADAAYSNPKLYTGIPLLIGTYAYAIQIYFDFAGYTDIARGTSRLFGIELARNFNFPYSATSVADFWRRWHMSFSRWILDYIFKPLQLLWRDWRQAGTALALLVTFLISGLWHGPRAGFLAWGALHGSYLAASVLYKPYQAKLYKYFGISKGKLLTYWQRLVTFNLVCLAWIFFRSNSIQDALFTVSRILDWRGSLAQLHALGLNRYIQINVMLNTGIMSTLLLGLVMIAYLILSRIFPKDPLEVPGWLRWGFYYALVLAIIFLAAPSTHFIYNQF